MFEILFRLLDFLLVVDPLCTLDRTDDKSHKQGGPKGGNQGNGQIPHELAHHVGPEEQGNKRRYRCDRGGDNGHSDFLRSILRCLKRGLLVFVLMPIDVFDNHDCIIDKDAERENKGKKDHEVQCDIKSTENHKRDEHRERNRRRYKDRILESEEHEQGEYDKDHPGHDAVLEFVYGTLNTDRLIVGYSQVDPGREHSLFLFYKVFDFAGYAQQVLSRPFSDGQRDNFVAVQPRIRLPVLKRIVNRCHVVQVDGLAVLDLDDDILQRPDLLEFTRHANGK